LQIVNAKKVLNKTIFKGKENNELPLDTHLQMTNYIKIIENYFNVDI